MQNLAGVLTGAATDVGTGPVLILLAMAFWPLPGVRRRPAGEPDAVGALPAPPRDPQQIAGPDPGT